MRKEISELYNRITADFYGRFGDNAHLYLITESEQLVSSLQYDAATRSYKDALEGTDEIIYGRSFLPDELVAAFAESFSNNEQVIAATTTADGAFDAVATKIGSLTALVSEINLAMSEQNAARLTAS